MFDDPIHDGPALTGIAATRQALAHLDNYEIKEARATLLDAIKAESG